MLEFIVQAEESVIDIILLDSRHITFFNAVIMLSACPVSDASAHFSAEERAAMAAVYFLSQRIRDIFLRWITALAPFLLESLNGFIEVLGYNGGMCVWNIIPLPLTVVLYLNHRQGIGSICFLPHERRPGSDLTP